MSSPDPQIEQLLSSYLDDAVTAKERALVDALLKSDPQIAADLKSLSEIHDLLGELDRQNQTTLPTGFSDRVIEQAMLRARLEGCAEDHPLMQVAVQPVSRSFGSMQPILIGVSTLVAIAASIAIVFSLVGTEPNSDPNNPAELAFVDPTAVDPIDGEINASQTEPSIAIAATQADSVDLADSIVQDRSSEDSLIASTEIQSEITNPNAIGLNQQESLNQESGSNAASILDAVVSVSATPPETIEVIRSVKAVLVLDIRLTDPTLGIFPIHDAMQRAELERSSEQELTQSIVASIASAVDDDSLSGSVIYLRAPAKQIDLFIFHMLQDRQSIQKVGLGIATDTPILELTTQMQAVDPTQIRQDFASQFNSGGADTLTSSLTGTNFIPVDSAAASVGMASASQPSEGPDVVSNVFLLIR